MAINVRAAATAEDVIVATVVIVAAAVNAARDAVAIAAARSKVQRLSRRQMKVRAPHNVRISGRINRALSKNHKNRVKIVVRDVRDVRAAKGVAVAAVAVVAIAAIAAIVASARRVTKAQPGSKTPAHWVQ